MFTSEVSVASAYPTTAPLRPSSGWNKERSGFFALPCSGVNVESAGAFSPNNSGCCTAPTAAFASYNLPRISSLKNVGQNSKLAVDFNCFLALSLSSIPGSSTRIRPF